MAKFPPQKGIYSLGSSYFEVVSIGANEVELVKVDKDGKSMGASQKVAKKKWEAKDYIKVDSTGNGEKKSNDKPKYNFVYNPDSQTVEVLDQAGVRVAELAGIEGSTGRSFYEDWCAKHGKDSKDPKTFKEFEDAFRGKDGLYVNGADGLDAYEVWKSHQIAGSDLSFNAFMESLRGKPGKDGHEGRDGEVGDTWKPYLSNDGKLYFENTRTKEKTETIDIRGPQGENAGPGKDGDTWEPYIADNGHQLYFKNQHGDIRGPFNVCGKTGETGEQGPDGLSAYQLWLKEGHVGDVHDFLMWVSKNADKGTDGEDGDTYIPHVEDGVLFFISSKTGKKIPGGRVIGPRGPQGEQGLNGHNIEHEYDYHDLKDFTCPIQEIPERLVSPSGDLNAYGSAEQHMHQTLTEIENIRKEGKKKDNKGSWIQEMFWWCSGADRPLLRMCPTEHSKYMGIGTVIFFTALMAMFSSYIAISYVFGGISKEGDLQWSWLAGGFAFFWALMIFFLDRFITNTMYSDGKVTISWLELRSALPRILISIFLGIVISAPLELKIFKQEIDDYIQTTAIDGNVEISAKIQQLDSIRANLQSSVTAYEKSTKPKKEDYTKVQSLNNEQAGVTRMATSRDENNRLTHIPITGKVSAKKDTLVYDAEAYNKAIADWGKNCREYRISLQNEVDNFARKIEQEKKYIRTNFDAASYGLYDRLSALHHIAYQDGSPDGYQSWDKDADYDYYRLICGGAIFLILFLTSIPFYGNAISTSYLKTEIKDGQELGRTIKRLNKPFKGANWWKGVAVILPWYGVVAFICGYCCDTLFHALPAYIFSAVGMIMMLFILIDVSPVFYKMMLADGQYEQWHHKEKSVTQDLIRFNFAQSIAQVNNSEVGKLAPMIFSKPWEKIKEILSVARNKREELGYGESYYTQEIEEDNKRLFKEVMDMKSAIIRAAYAAWYRDMRDSILGIHMKPTNGGPDIPPSGDGGNHDDNAETKRRGTSPEYERDPDDNHSGTPEDYFSEYERAAGTAFEEESEADEDAEEVDIESEETDDSEEDSAEAPSDADDNSHPDEEGYAEREESDADESPEESSSSDASAAESTDNSDNPDSEWEHVVDDESDEENERKK